MLQFSSVAQLGPTLCEPMDCSTPGFPVHHQLPELTQTHVASKVMLKILQARLQQYVNRELSEVPAGFRKGRGARDQIVTIC